MSHNLNFKYITPNTFIGPWVWLNLAILTVLNMMLCDILNNRRFCKRTGSLSQDPLPTCLSDSQQIQLTTVYKMKNLWDFFIINSSKD